MPVALLVIAAMVIWLFASRRIAQRADANAWQAADKAELDHLSDAIGGPLYFRRVTAADAEVVVAIRTNPETIKANGLDASATPSLEEHRKAFAAAPQFELLIGVERATDQVVGCAQFQDSAVGAEGSISIGLVLHADYRGLGYARQILGAGISVARAAITAHQSNADVYVGTAADNFAVQRIMQQLGYQPEPETHSYSAPDGQVFDSYWYRCGPGTPAPKFVDDDTKEKE